MIYRNNNQQIFEYSGNQDDLLDKLAHLANSGLYVFRGYNKQDQLLPIIIREKDYSGVEYELMNEFEKYGSHYFSANTPIDFLSYGQHYGLPTRLIDFTYNPFIALSFALFSQKSPGRYTEEEDKDYYYIRYCDINENIHLKSVPVFNQLSFGSFESDSISKRCEEVLRKYSECLSDVNNQSFSSYINGLSKCYYQPSANSKNYEQIITQKVGAQKLCFIDPNQSNQRIIMQQGLFMLPYILDVEKHLELISVNTSVIKIHRNLREPLLKYLDTLGYNTFRLMPDLSSICAAVTQKVKDRRVAQSNLFKKKESKYFNAS